MQVEQIPIGDLKPHPRNYRSYPDDQLDHIVQSIKSYGFYRNIIIAREGTVLAGHGVVQACKKAGISKVPAFRVDLDPLEAAALKILVGDNEIYKLGEVDDRALTELLKEIKISSPDELLGTGYDAIMLSSLLYITRPESEIADKSAASEWAGMPIYNSPEETYKLMINFETEKDRDEFLKAVRIKTIHRKFGKLWSTRWPEREKDDEKSLRFSESEVRE